MRYGIREGLREEDQGGQGMSVIYVALLVLIAVLQIVNIILTLIDLHWWKVYEDDLQDDYEMWEETNE